MTSMGHNDCSCVSIVERCRNRLAKIVADRDDGYYAKMYMEDVPELLLALLVTEPDTEGQS